MRQQSGGRSRFVRVWAIIFALSFVLGGIVIVSNPVSALTSGDFEYRLINGGTEVEITGYIGVVGDVIIPSIVDGKAVTSIGIFAFSQCTSLVSVIIPNTVTSISGSAFSGCVCLTSIIIPNSVTSIGSLVFEGCSSLNSIIIPDSVTTIGSQAFYGCTSLMSITIPSGVTSIGDGAFRYCTSLNSIGVSDGNTNFASVDGILYNKAVTTLLLCPQGKPGMITIPNSVTSIGNRAFESCTSLLSITIPSTITSIGDSMFSGCIALVSITIPSSVTSIGDSTFSECTSLVSITIPSSVTSIGDYMFRKCASLNSITIPSTVTSIGYLAFQYCTSLTSIIIPDSVTTIGSQAFSGCTSLMSITIPSGVTSIGDWAFSGCTSLASIDVHIDNPNYTSVDGILFNKGATVLIQCPGGKTGTVVIPNGVASIRSSAFENCASLKSITLPESVTLFGYPRFLGCTSLTSINVHADNQNFTSVDGVLYNKAMTTLLQCPVGKTGSVNIPDNVTTITGYAFYSCTSLKSVTIPNTVTSIGSFAFYSCTSLTSIIIPNNITSIIANVFSSCTSLTSIIIPNNVTHIGAGAFRRCTSLTSVTIPNTVTSINEEPFPECTSLAAIDVSVDNPNYASIDGILYNKAVTNLIQCPGGKTGNVTIPGSVTSIDYCAFVSCISLTSVTIPSSVTFIGEDPFWLCTSLRSIDVSVGNPKYASVDGILYNKAVTELIQCPGGKIGTVTIPDTVIGIGDYAFASCTSLSSITIPGSVINISDRAFRFSRGDHALYGHSSLVSIIVDASNMKYASIDGILYNKAVTTLIESPKGRTGTVNIPTTVASIDEYAFYGCTHLTSIIIPDNVSSIGERAFMGCRNLTSITFHGLTAPTYVGLDWIIDTNDGLLGYANASSNFPAPGEYFHGLKMGSIMIVAPDAPTGLTAVAGSNQVTLNWSAPASDGGSPIDYFIVYQDGVEIRNVTGYSTTITGLTNGQTYSFKVSAHSLAGEGNRSNTVSIVPCAVSNSPLGLTAISGNGQVTLNWASPAFDGGSPVDYFIVYQDGKDVKHTTGTSTIITGLINGQTYAFTVAAHNAAGNGPQSDLIYSTPFSSPDAPTGLVAVAGKANITLNWTAPALDGGRAIDYYAVHVDGVDTVHVNGTSVILEGLQNGQIYEIHVTAHNTAGDGSPSISVSAIPFTIPDSPGGFSAKAGNGNVTLNWTAPTFDGGRMVDYYLVFKDGVEMMNVTVTSALITHLSNGQAYEFYVVAHNLAGNGLPSSTTSSAPYTVPGAPTGLKAVVGNSNVTLNWTAPAFDGGRDIDYYIVYQDGVDVGHYTGLSTTITGLSSGDIYSFTIAAHNVAGIGTQTDVIYSTPYAVPNAPFGLTAISGDDQVTLNWNAPAFDGGSNITGYKIYRGTSSGALTLIATVIGVTYLDTIVTNGQEYFYKVSAVNSAGESVLTEEVTATPEAPASNEGISTIMIVGIVAILALAMAAVVSVMFFRGKGKGGQ